MRFILADPRPDGRIEPDFGDPETSNQGPSYRRQTDEPGAL